MTDDQAEGSDPNVIPPAILWTIAIAGHFAAAIIFAILLGLGLSIFLVLLAALIEVGIWQRQRLLWLVNEFQNGQARSRIRKRKLADVQLDSPGQPAHSASETETALQTGSRPPPVREPKKKWSAPPIEAERPSTSAERSAASTVVEIGFKDDLLPPAPRTAPQPIPRWPNFFGSSSSKRSISSLNQQRAVLPALQVRFFGPGTALNIGRCELRDPLVYATGDARHGTFDASLIDGSLSVSVSGTTPTEELPYWPSYHLATPEQRSRYLDWLQTGRRDENVELGYVFIYFYGLERRILLDGADHVPIIEELLRLRKIYAKSRSFDRYSASLLWLAVALAGQGNVFPRHLFDAVIWSTSRWDEDHLARCLAYYHEQKERLPPQLAFQVAKLDNRTSSSIITRRHEEKFQELFLRKYSEKFPVGMELKASKRSRPLYYHPASGTLQDHSNAVQLSRSLLEIPDVLGITSQFKPLVEIWEQCIEELRAFDRAKRTSGGELTAAAFEALPTALRTGEHPEFDRWFRLWEEKASADGLPVVPVEALAALKGFNRRGTLLKTQCAKLLSTADCLGIGVEPDARLTGRNYRWDDQVVLFFRESDEAATAATYQAAALLLELGLVIAHSDDEIDKDEIAHISKHLEDQFSLTLDESKRLECRRQLLCLFPSKEARISAAVRNKLGKSERRLIGEYLVGVAAADQHISPAEMASLRRLYIQLDLDPKELESLIAPLVPVKPIQGPKEVVVAKDDGFHLDLRAVSRIMHETKEVARILQEAMAVDDEDESDDDEPLRSDNVATIPQSRIDEIAPAAATATAVEIGEQTCVNSLADRYRPFLTALIAKAEWSPADARQLAQSHHVMLQGAIEAINEWSQDQFGDWLIEEGDPLVIHSELLPE